MLKINMSGMEKLQRELEELQRAMKSLDGEIAKVIIDPDDPTSIDRAVQDMKKAVDQKASRYRSNAIVKAFADESKKVFEKNIRDRARRG